MSAKEFQEKCRELHCLASCSIAPADRDDFLRLAAEVFSHEMTDDELLVYDNGLRHYSERVTDALARTSETHPVESMALLGKCDSVHLCTALLRNEKEFTKQDMTVTTITLAERCLNFLQNNKHTQDAGWVYAFLNYHNVLITHGRSKTDKTSGIVSGLCATQDRIASCLNAVTDATPPVIVEGLLMAAYDVSEAVETHGAKLNVQMVESYKNYWETVVEHRKADDVPDSQAKHWVIEFWENVYGYAKTLAAKDTDKEALLKAMESLPHSVAPEVDSDDESDDESTSDEEQELDDESEEDDGAKSKRKDCGDEPDDACERPVKRAKA